MNQNQIKVDELSLVAVYIEPSFDGIRLANASGFVVEWDGHPYLITNWHVVSGRNPDTGLCLDKKTAAIPNELFVKLHSSRGLGRWEELRIPLLGTDGPLWIEHPNGASVDVVAIPIERIAKVQIFSLNLALSQVDMSPAPAMSISIIGYPLGLATGGGLPIWKTGHIASDPEVDYEPGRPAFLIDATVRKGMSGAPAIIRQSNFMSRGGSQIISSAPVTKFMGVYAGRLSEDSEIGRVWRPFVIADILRPRFSWKMEHGRTAGLMLNDRFSGQQ